jgi:flagellar hook-basal body complex protein FliE
MANELPIQGPSGPQRNAPIQKSGAPNSTADASAAGAKPSVAFRALLEGLEAKARDLEAKSKSLAKPEELPGAVQGAKASLEDALSIRDRLLEAYNQARARDAAERAGGKS